MDDLIVFARWRQYAPHSNTRFPEATRLSIPNCISLGTAVLAQLTILYNGRSFSPIKLPLRVVGFEPPSSTWFREPTRVHILNDISNGSSVLAGLTTVTDRPTDRHTDRPRYSISNNSPHPRPKNR